MVKNMYAYMCTCSTCIAIKLSYKQYTAWSSLCNDETQIDVLMSYKECNKPKLGLYDKDKKKIIKTRNLYKTERLDL